MALLLHALHFLELSLSHHNMKVAKWKEVHVRPFQLLQGLALIYMNYSDLLSFLRKSKLT